ncbi:RNA polymerase sigma factor [Sphingobacterium suaedae]|uniref:RNA polymerase sigma factor n=1 Tax=Sphingobacterium suaedae TaxID=1686402 RepID=A0ABW5KK17_9SPHI
MLQFGNELGLRYFMSRFAEGLHFFAYSITKNREVAEEIVSESFCKLWLGRTKAVSVQAVKSYLYLVTRNACYDYVDSTYYKAVDLGEELLWNKIENRSDILTQIIYSELIEQIVNELEKLPKYQAEVFRLAYLEGLDTQEICALLGTTANNIYFARSKALSALKLVFKKKDISLYGALLILKIFFLE